MSRSIDPIEWSRRAGLPRLYLAAWGPLFLLGASLKFRQEPLPYALTLIVLALVVIGFLVIMSNDARMPRPKRDRSRPILQQVQDDLRDEPQIEAPEPPPAPFSIVARVVRTFGAAWPKSLETLVGVVHFAAFLALGANVLLDESLSLDQLLSRAGLPATGLSRWDAALITCGIALLGSLRLSAAAWRKELDGAGITAHVEPAYG